MHETGIVRDLVGRLEEAARAEGAVRITRVEVRLGALSGFSPEHFREHFEDESRGTLAEGAALDVTVSADPADPHAQSVLLRGMDLDVEDAGPGS